MKKVIALFLFINISCFCSGMVALQRQSTQKLNKIVKEGNEIYYNAETGHTQDVKMFIQDGMYAEIQIPLEFSEDIEETPKELPEKTQLVLERTNLLKMPSCSNCYIDNIKVNVKYKDKNGIMTDKSDIYAGYVKINIKYKGKDIQPKQYYFRIMKHWKDGIDTLPAMLTLLPEDIEEVRKAGIDTLFEVNPTSNYITVECNKKSCLVYDDDKNIVNKISVFKKVSFNKSKLKELFAEEKQAKIEAKRKEQEEIKRKAQEEKIKKRQHRIQQEKCVPAIYILHQANYVYVDPFLQKQATDTFVQYNCDVIAREIFVGY